MWKKPCLVSWGCETPLWAAGRQKQGRGRRWSPQETAGEEAGYPRTWKGGGRGSFESPRFFVISPSPTLVREASLCAAWCLMVGEGLCVLLEFTQPGGTMPPSRSEYTWHTWGQAQVSPTSSAKHPDVSCWCFQSESWGFPTAFPWSLYTHTVHMMQRGPSDHRGWARQSHRGPSPTRQFPYSGYEMPWWVPGHGNSLCPHSPSIVIPSGPLEPVPIRIRPCGLA